MSTTKKKIKLPSGITPEMVGAKSRTTVREGASCKMEITPEMAKNWLKKSDKNRKISNSNLKYIISQIQQGKWRFNGENIAFDEDGRLLDGQHRLTAAVESKTPIVSNLIFGIDKEAFHTMDTGKIRTAGDILSAQGHYQANVLASVARLIISLETGHKGVASGGLKRTIIDNEDIMDFVATRKFFMETVSEAYKIWSSMKIKFITAQIFCAMYFLFWSKNTSDAAKFMTGVAKGVNISEDSPQYHLKTNLEKMHNERLKRRYSTYHKCALIIKAWNLYRTNKKFERLFFRENEEIQEIQ